MADVTIPERFPKAAFRRVDVEAERQIRLSIPGCVSSAITETDEDWVLASVFETLDG